VVYMRSNVSSSRQEQSALMPMQDALRPAQDAAEGAIQQLARLVSQQPDLQFPISNDRAETWLINTYLDEVTHETCDMYRASEWILQQNVYFQPVQPCQLHEYCLA